MLAVIFASVATTTLAQDDIVRFNASRPDDDSGTPLAVLAADPVRAEAAAAAANGSCRTVGEYVQVFSGINRFRGNIYRIDANVTLLSVQMELNIQADATLHFALYEQNSSGQWTSLVGSKVISVIDPIGVDFYSSGTLSCGGTPGCDLTAGTKYAMVFGWGADVAIGYGRDVLPLGSSYPGATPESFDIGDILGRAGATIFVPFPPTLPAIGSSGANAYSMILCMEPALGACCSPLNSSCTLQFENQCNIELGEFFFGERTLCLDNVCDFGACCRPCVGKCDDNWPRKACEATDGVTHWSGAVCPGPLAESLCPPVTGACCKSGGVCEELCESDCVADGGIYRGDGSDCVTNPCVGACCLESAGLGCIEMTPTGCTGLNGRYRGDATTCATLAPGNECGGACCVFVGGEPTECGTFAEREACINDDLSDKAYRGDGVTCSIDPVDPPDPLAPDTYNDFCKTLTIAFYGACCMPNGTCINMPDAATCEDDSGGTFNTGELCGVNGFDCGASPCCLPDGTCERLTQAACDARIGLWQPGATTCSVAVCETGACCESDDARCSIITPTACTNANGTYFGGVLNCDNIADTCGPSLNFGACCVDGSFCLDALTFDECDERNGVHSPRTTCALLDADIDLDACDQRGACCTQTGTCLSLTLAECVAFPILGTFTADQVCTSTFCPSGACCHGEDSCTVTGETFCRRVDGLDGIYKGPGTACTANACIPSGACCVNGTCDPDQLRADCDAAGGIYLGDDATCDNAPCTQGTCCNRGDCTNFQIVSQCPTGGAGVDFQPGTFCSLSPCEPYGACCFVSGVCIDDQSQTACESAGGTISQNLLCSQISCEPTGPCCFRDGTCTDATSQSSCEFQGGTLSSEASCATAVCEEIGACCLRNGTCLNDVIRADCEAQRGTSTPDRTCGQIPLCPILGACCLPDTEDASIVRCTNDMTRSDCQSQNGTYRGEETDCPFEGSFCGSCCSFTGCEDNVMSSECDLIPSEPNSVPFKPGVVCTDRDNVGEAACIPRGACCPSVGECLITDALNCTNIEFGSYAGDGSTCEDAPDFCAVGACCNVFLPGEQKCQLRTRFSCDTEPGAVFQGIDVDCSDQSICTVGSCCPATGFDDCTPSTVVSACDAPENFRSGQDTCQLCEGRGACCVDDDVPCQVLTQSECLGAGATYQGNGTLCPAPEDDDVCFVGACCNGLGECTDQRRADCEAGGGRYGGAGATCGLDTCPSLLSATPESCSIDPAQPSLPDGAGMMGISSITLTYSNNVFGLTIDDFLIDATPGNASPPAVVGFAISGAEITFDFETPIPTREWICITDLFYGGMICVAAQPGDVDGNRLVAPGDDVDALVGHLVAPVLPLRQCDIDRSGVCSPLDIMREIDLLNGAESYIEWRGRVMDVCPAAP